MTKSIRPAVVAVLAALSLVASCTPLKGDASGANQQADYGELTLQNVTTTPNIDSLTFRGTFRNRFDDPVDGIRVVLRIMQEPSPTAPVIARAQKVLDDHLEPGAHIGFEITVKVKPTSLANPGIFLHGFAVRRGGEELPISPLWEE